jgi:antitoxin component YwqK of YwqJK toxin-antitoxin module
VATLTVEAALPATLDYAEWVSLNQLAPGTDQAENEPAGDGLPNLLKYARGLNPNSFVSTNPLSLVVITNAGRRHAGFEFAQARQNTGVQVVLETSVDLTLWTTIPTLEGRNWRLDDVLDRVQLVDATSLEAMGKRFYRLKFLVADPIATGSLSLGNTTTLVVSDATPAGATFVVNRPGNPLHGLSLEIPPGAYPYQIPIRITENPIVAHTFGSKVTPLTPLIHVDNGGALAAALMKVTVPIQLPLGWFAMAFFYDPVSGRLEGIPSADLRTNSITIATLHFSSFLVSGIPIDKLPAAVDTGFRPGVDDWEFVNLGSVKVPKGHCAGQSMSAMHFYYANHVYRPGGPHLYNHFDNNGAFSTPGIGDDNTSGYKLASMVQWDYNAGWHSNRNIQQEWLANDSGLFTYYRFLYAMEVTKAPQYVAVSTTNSGHALIAYRAGQGSIEVADPNYPGVSGRRISLNSDQSRFDPYYSGPNANQLGVAFDIINFYGLTAVTDWSAVGDRWQEFYLGELDAFPDYAFSIRDKYGGWLATLSNARTSPTYLTTTGDSFVDDEWEFDGRYSIYSHYVDPQGNRIPSSMTNLLTMGTNSIGMRLEIRDSTSGDSSIAWLGFHWLVFDRVQNRSLDCNCEFTVDYASLERAVLNPRAGDGAPAGEYFVNELGQRHGPYVEYWNFDTNRIMVLGCYVSGRKDGTWSLFYPNGVIHRSAHYAQDVLSGKYETYFEDGKPDMTGQHDPDGKRIGIWRSFAPSGLLLWERRYDESGYVRERQFYSDTNVVRRRYTYLESNPSLLVGEDVVWRINSTVEYVANYDQQGRLNGLYSHWHENGMPSIAGNYSNGLRTGEFKTWDVDGTLGQVMSYQDDLPHGSCRRWFHGVLSLSSNYEKGVLQGAYEEYYATGELSVSGQYGNGIKTGTWTYYWKDGTIADEQMYP